MNTATASQRTSSTMEQTTHPLPCTTQQLPTLWPVEIIKFQRQRVNKYNYNNSIVTCFSFVDKWINQTARESNFAHIAKQWFQILCIIVTEQVILMKSQSVGTSVRHSCKMYMHSVETFSRFQYMRDGSLSLIHYLFSLAIVGVASSSLLLRVRTTFLQN